MRPPVLRASLLRDDELIVDCFAGGGGASTGIAMALGRDPDIAINHSAAALAMHAANHPGTTHYREDIWRVDPKAACRGRPVGLLWLSPDCTHHSRAKGGKKKIRGLAWVATRWAHDVRPRVICLENVEEFSTWGPLDENDMPCPRRAGQTFRAFVGKLRRYGYVVEWRSLVAADYGSPTTRRRLFLVARCDGHPIVWPEPTHGKGRERAWRTAAEIIDWSLPCPSIFGRKRPLADATMRRIAEGLRRYVIECSQPFIVPVKSWGGGGNGPRSIEQPLRTVTASKRGEHAIVTPYLAPLTHRDRSRRTKAVDQPVPTVTAAHRGELALVAPHLVRAAFIAKHYSGVIGSDARAALGTVTARDHHAVVAAWLTKFYGTGTGSQLALPCPTVTANDHGGGHLAEVRAFLVGYYSNGGSRQQSLLDPLHTITTKARFGLVMIHGEPYQIVDIGMRMLAPHELFGAQGFPREYVIAPTLNAKRLTKTAQIACAGNSVPPQLAEAVVGAQFGTREAVAA